LSECIVRGLVQSPPSSPTGIDACPSDERHEQASSGRWGPK